MLESGAVALLVSACERSRFEPGRVLSLRNHDNATEKMIFFFAQESRDNLDAFSLSFGVRAILC